MGIILNLKEQDIREENEEYTIVYNELKKHVDKYYAEFDTITFGLDFEGERCFLKFINYPLDVIREIVDYVKRNYKDYFSDLIEETYTYKLPFYTKKTIRNNIRKSKLKRVLLYE